MNNNQKSGKAILFTASLGRGNRAFVERTAYGAIAAKVDGHPDDPIFTVLIGTPKEAFKAVSSYARSVKNNRLGRVILGKHAPKDYPQNVAVRNSRLFCIA